MPKGLLDAIVAINKNVYLTNILQYLQQSHPEIYFAFEFDSLELKIKKWLNSKESTEENSLGKLILKLKQQSE